MVIESAPEVTPERAAYYQKVDSLNLSPLWMVFNDIITPNPKSGCVPVKWDYLTLKAALLEAAPLITAKEAERRVLVLENPGLRGMSKITTSLYAGLQLVLPDEVAPAHRHSQSALRFIMDGSGAHTNVNGERTYMNPGDFVITAPWTWHDHGNDSEEPMIWLDGLDVPMVQLFDCSFAEGYASDEQPVGKPAGDSLARYGNSLLPVDYDQRPLNSPVFSYPYDRTLEVLETMRKGGEWNEHHGIKLRFINPTTGDFAMPSIGTFMQLLPKYFKTKPYQSTDATVFCCTEGSGKTTIGTKTIAWESKDIFVVPSWHSVIHEANEDAVLFSYSDRPAQKKLGLWREALG